jgi:integrase
MARRPSLTSLYSNSLRKSMPTKPSHKTNEKTPKRLLDRVREAIRLKHYSIRTEQAYLDWIKRYILFHDKRHPRNMGAAEIEAFLTHLAVDQKVAASTQNQALSALLFLYRDVLRQELENSIDAVRARQPKHLPTVLTREEVFKVIGFLSGAHHARPVCKRQLGEPLDRPASTSASVAISSVTPLPRTCLRVAMTSVPSKSCWDTRM